MSLASHRIERGQLVEHDDCPAWCVIPHALMPWVRLHASAPVEVGTLGRACLMQPPAGGGHPYILTVPEQRADRSPRRPVRWELANAVGLACALEQAGRPAAGVEVRRLLALVEHVPVTVAHASAADPESPDFVPECVECGVWPCEVADRFGLLDLYAPADALAMAAVGPTTDEAPF